MVARLRAAPTAAWVWAFTAYSWTVTSVSAAWFARRLAAGRGESLSVAASLLWQGGVYAAWLPAAGLVWLVLRRFGAGARGIAASFAAGLAVVPLEALAASLIDRAFAGGDAPLAARMLERTPVCLLLYSAIVAVGLAAVHHRRAREARARNALLEAALAEARAVAAPTEATERLMVMSGARRIPVEVSAVEWFGAADNYVVVHWTGREGLLRATLQSLEARLDARLFARAHRSSLINLAHVREARPLSDGSWRLTMASGDEVVTSRTYRDALLERLGSAPTAPGSSHAPPSAPGGSRGKPA